jgi:hypothetical protein
VNVNGLRKPLQHYTFYVCEKGTPYP